MLENNNLSKYKKIADELSLGDGIFIENNFLTTNQLEKFIAMANAYEPDRFGTVRGLLDKDPIWEVLLEHPLLTTVSELTLGAGFQLGSVDIKYFRPEALGAVKRTIPHVDYPGSSSIGTATGNDGRYGKYTLGLKFFIPLTDLTLENGATAYVPGSQKWNADPELYGRLFFDLHSAKKTERLIVQAGTLAIWNNRFWHAELGNRSPTDKLLMHVCVVPRFVAPPHDLEKMHGHDLVAKINSRMRASSEVN